MTATPTVQRAGADSQAPVQSGRYAFGLFELEIATGVLRRAGRTVRLAPQPTRLLMALVERAGRIVTREELKAVVWDGQTFVDFEQGLNFCIKQIRAALGDGAENPRFVETVPRRGYRFIAPVERLGHAVPAAPTDPPLSSPPARATRRSRAAFTLGFASVLVLAVIGTVLVVWSVDRRIAGPGKTMIAVLPFENLSGDPSQDYFSEGFTDELIGQLGRLDPSNLGVIARTSTLSYRNTTKSAAEIGRDLGAQHLVEGTVRRSGDRVRINAQLIRVSDQSHVWAEIYEGEIRDILAIQHEVGHAIARQIIATLDSATASSLRHVDPAVYDLYLRGRFLWNRRRVEEVDRAAASFREAVRLDPTFAPAYAGLADTLTAGSRFAALDAAERALSLDDRLAEGYTAKAHVRMHMLQWTEAEEAFRHAIALDPSHVPARYFFAEYLTVRGRCAEAIDQARQGLALDPVSAIASHVAGVTQYYCREYDSAMEYLRKALELDPEHFWTHGRIALVLERKRAYDAALAEFSAVAAVRGLYSYAASGRTAEARRLMREAVSRPDHEQQAYYIAAGHVALDDHDEALEWLTTAVRRQVYDVVYLNVDPRFDALRQRPEFQALLREGGWQ